MCLQYHTALASPNHPVLITGSYDKTVRIWNLDTGDCIRTLRGHTRAIRALQFDQRLLFTGSMDGTVRMWNWRAGECLRVLEGHTDGVVALHYNGQLLASGSADNTVNVWNFRNGTKFTLRGHEERVNAVLLWDGKTSPGDLDPTTMPTFSGRRGVSPHRSDGHTTSLSPVASTSASGSSHDSKSDKGDAQVPPGMMLFSASDDHTIKLWDLTTRKCIRTFSGHRAHVQSVKVLMVDMTEAEIRARKRLRSATPPVDHHQPMGYSGFVSASSASMPPLLGNAAVVEGMADMLVDVPEGFDPHAHRSARGKEIQPRVFVHDAVGHVSTPDVEMHEADAMAMQHAHGTDKEEKEQKRAVLVSASLDGTVKVWDVEAGCETGTLFGYVLHIKFIGTKGEEGDGG
jgi:F-box/WD-40 domain protein MET30